MIYGIITFFLLIATFSLSSETLTEKENRETFFFLTAFIVTIVTIISAFKHFKNERKFSAIGISTASLISCYATMMLGLICFDNLNYYGKFDKRQWSQAEFKSFKMAKTLAKDDELIGLTKQQVIEKIGTTKEFLINPKCNLLEIPTDENWHLRVEFKNDTAIKAYLWQEGLGI